ncbi:MAG: DUF2934 domain-containing protein [Rhizobiales bacterium]|nr:DUF2934 domain-containing protein [Hyphomicrobiales bacterium]
MIEHPFRHDQEAVVQEDLEQKIRERAYHLWVAEGCRDGESDRHWLVAERELLGEFAATAPAPAEKKRASRKAANSNVETVAKAPAKIRRRGS